MNADLANARLENPIIGRLESIPIVSAYVKTRGWSFLLSWCHRVSGWVLIAFLWFHIYSLTALYIPEQYDAKMKLFSFLVFGFLEWALAIPLIFHAFNGGRLVLYESFGRRDDESLIRWMFGLGILYLALLGLLMLMGNQSVSAFFFWITMVLVALAAAYGVASKVWISGHSVFWRFQRITGVYLLVMAPAHFVFMHLNPSMAKEAEMVIARMQSLFIKAVDLSLLISAAYHGGYGLLSVIKDYLSCPWIRGILTIAALFVMLVFAWAGAKLVLSI